MVQKISTPQSILPNSGRQGRVLGFLRKLVALVLLVGGLGASREALAQRFTADNLYTRLLTGGNVTVTNYTGKGTATPKFASSDLSKGATLDLTTDSLTIKTIVANFNSAGTAITQASLNYRVYLQGTTATNIPSYSNAKLNLTSADNTNSNPVIYSISGQSIDLLAFPRTSGGGTFVVDIYFTATYDDGSTTDFTDPGNGATNPYSATFKVKAPAVTPAGSTTIWQSTSSSAWFNSANWSNGVPTGTANAIIPENTTGTKIVFPILNSTSLNYAVKNLTLQGTTNSGKAQLTIQGAVLHVYGNISQLSGGLVGVVTNNAGVADSTQNSTIIFAGSNDQFITGRLNVPDIIIAGSGTKSVANVMAPSNTLSFRPKSAAVGVLLQTASATNNSDGTVTYRLDTTGNSLINLSSTGVINTTTGSNETITSYALGIVEATGALVSGTAQVFGNIGLDFLPNHSVSPVTVQRIIGDPLIGPTIANNGNQPVPIQRQYNIIGDDNSTNQTTNVSTNTVVFHYLPSAFELNGIPEANLTMFRTNTGSAPYHGEGGVLDQVARTVTRADLPTFNNYYLTLGDKDNPLPVSLAVFTVTRSGINALVNWTTATEKNNKGFNVQVSTNGVSYRTLSFVASQSPNSAQALNYKYIDTETGKTGTRYYRLEQVDEDGTLAYSPVRAVNFDGAAATSAALVAYPNPFSDAIGLTVDGIATTEGTIYVKLVDMTGRTVRDQKVNMAGASTMLDGLSELRSGLYLAKVILPDGTTQTVRVQKQ